MLVLKEGFFMQINLYAMLNLFKRQCFIYIVVLQRSKLQMDSLIPYSIYERDTLAWCMAIFYLFMSNISMLNENGGQSSFRYFIKFLTFVRPLSNNL